MQPQATLDAPPDRRMVDRNAPIVLILLFLDSFHFVFARLLSPLISPRVSAFYVMGIATLVVGGFAIATRQLNFGVLRKHLGFFVLIGLLIGGSTNLTFVAVGYVDPGAAALISQLSIPISIVLSVIWLKERFTRVKVIGAVLAMVGAVIIALQPSDFFRIGSLMIMIATTLYTFHTALVKRNGDVDFVNFFFFRLLFTTLALFSFSAVQNAVVWPSAAAWPWLILVAGVDIVLSRVLFYTALRRLHLSAHTLILTLSPVIATAWSFALFGVVPTLQQIIGGIIVLAGVLLATRKNA
jgi:O-acetylserine/cysteine efflux transporter